MPRKKQGGWAGPRFDIDEFRSHLKERVQSNREAFKGPYQQELNMLLGISREEIDQIIPGTTDLEIYDQLITVVKEASAANISRAELKLRIEELGEIGIAIAKQIPNLAELLI